MATIFKLKANDGKEYLVALRFSFEGFYGELTVCDTEDNLKKVLNDDVSYGVHEGVWFNVILASRGRQILDLELFVNDQEKAEAAEEAILNKYGLTWDDEADETANTLVQGFECRLNGWSD